MFYASSRQIFFICHQRSAQQEIQAAVNAALPQAGEIRIIAGEEMMFVDPGVNFERILCPECQAALPFDWWTEMMDHAYEGCFVD